MSALPEEGGRLLGHAGDSPGSDYAHNYGLENRSYRNGKRRKAVGHTSNVLDMANSCDHADSTSESQDTLNREACMCKA